MTFNNVPYVSLDRIFAKLSRDLGVELAEGDVVEWSAEALEAIGAITQYRESIAFIEVKNYQCELPKGLIQIQQIARNYCTDIEHEDCQLMCPTDAIAAATDSTTETPSQGPVCLDCNGKIIGDYELAYYRPYYDLIWEWDLGVWRNIDKLLGCFRPIKLATNTFFLDNRVTNRAIDSNSFPKTTMLMTEDEYKMIPHTNVVRFNFEKGQIALSYYKQIFDPETGYPMIPDTYAYTTAITKYVTYKVMCKNYYSGKEGAERLMMKAEQDWHWYCKQAGNMALIPEGADGIQNLIEQTISIIPRSNSHRSFFGNLNKRNFPHGR